MNTYLTSVTYNPSGKIIVVRGGSGCLNNHTLFYKWITPSLAMPPLSVAAC